MFIPDENVNKVVHQIVTFIRELGEMEDLNEREVKQKVRNVAMGLQNLRQNLLSGIDEDKEN